MQERVKATSNFSKFYSGFQKERPIEAMKVHEILLLACRKNR